MTTKRWLDASSDADPGERAVLQSGLDADPPPGAERVIWRDLLAALPPAVPPGGGGGVASSAGAGAGGGAGALGAGTLATLAKGFAAGVGVSLAVAGVAEFGTAQPTRAIASSATSRSAPGLTATTQARGTSLVPTPELPVTSPPGSALPQTGALPPSDAPSVALAAESKPGVPNLEHAPVAAAAPVAAGSIAAFPLPAESRLEEEATLLNRARAELRAGKLAEAFASLEASRERFSAPELHQEREALTIELLHRSGERAEAGARARRFLARHPESPHAVVIQGFARP